VYTQIPHSLGVSDELLHRRVHADIPKLYFAASTTTNEFSHTAALHVHLDDPGFVFLPYFDHAVAWGDTAVVDADGAVAETCDEDVARNLLGGETGDAGAGARGNVLFDMPLVDGWRGGSCNRTYTHTHFPWRIPHSDDLHITSYKHSPPSLLPIGDQPRAPLRR
jgi:hypothetical protein